MLRIVLAIGLLIGLTFSGEAACAQNTPNNVTTATAQCNVTGNTTRGEGPCPTGQGVAVTTAAYGGARSDVGAAVTPIDVWGVCRYIDNASPTGTSIFVPFKSVTEWDAFLNSASTLSLSFISLVHCSTPYPQATYNIPAPYQGTANCTNTVTVATPQLYARWSNSASATWTEPSAVAPFTCYNGSSTIQDSIIWKGLDSDTNNPASWQPVVNYGPNLAMTITAPQIPQNLGTSITVAAGTPVTLTWNSQPFKPSDVLSCTGFTALTGAAPACPGASGSVVVSPTANTVYTVTVLDTANGLSSSASVTINVQQGFNMYLTSSLQPCGQWWLSWNVTDNAGVPFTCTASSTDGQFTGPITVVPGGTGVMPSTTPTATDTLNCTDALGNSGSASATIMQGIHLGMWIGMAGPTVPLGQSATVNYYIVDPTGYSWSCNESASDGSFSGSFSGNSSTPTYQTTVTPTTVGNVTYNITCTDNVGETIDWPQVITVTP